VQCAGMVCCSSNCFRCAHGVRNQPFHRRACQMQSAEDAIQRDIRKHLTGIERTLMIPACELH